MFTKCGTFACSVVSLCFLCGSLAGQASVGPASPTPAFQGYDVISVKPNKSGSGNTSINTSDTTMRAENVSIKMLLTNAYDIRDALISGLPPWALSTRWDINAKLVEPDPSQKDRKLSREEDQARWRAEVLSILTERFQVKVHNEEKVQPIYDLTTAKGGSKLKPTDAPESKRGSMWINNSELNATGVPIASLLTFLAGETKRNVMDKTGLTGDYDLTLKWSREDQAVNSADNGSTDKAPSIFTALQEQAGLQLVSNKGPVTTLVVDSIQMPAAD